MLQGILLTSHSGCTPLQHCLLQWLALTCRSDAALCRAECQGAQKPFPLQGCVGQLSRIQVYNAGVHAHRQNKCISFTYLSPPLYLHATGLEAMLVRPAKHHRVMPGSPDITAWHLDDICRGMYLMTVFARLSAHAPCRSSWAALSCASAGSLTAAGA